MHDTCKDSKFYINRLIYVYMLSDIYFSLLFVAIVCRK